MEWDLVRHIWFINFYIFDYATSAHRKQNVPDNAKRADSQIQTLTQLKGRKKVATNSYESDDDGAGPPMHASRNKPPSRSGSVLLQKSVRTGKVTKKPLFLDSDNEENHNEDKPMDGEGVDGEETLQSSFETRQTVTGRSKRETKSRKPAPIIVDDDSDDDAVFKGFKGQKKGR